MRFSDEQLAEFHAQFIKHVEDYEKRMIAGDKKFNELIASVEKLLIETRGVVQLSRDLQSVARIGMKVQNFGVWLVKWPVIGVGLYAMYTWIVDHLPG